MTRLETKRLIIRKLVEEDIDRVLMVRADRGIAEATGDRMLLSREEAEGYVRSGDALGIVEKGGDDSVIGLLVLFRYAEDGGSADLKCCNFCYSLLSQYRGHGYMTEIVGAVCTYLFENENMDRLGISVFSWNVNSKNVALKAGFRFFPQMDGTVTTKLGKKEQLEWFFLTRNAYMSSRGLPQDYAWMADYEETVASGTADDMALQRNAILSKLHSLDPEEFRRFLYQKSFPGRIYRTPDFREAKKKVRLLRSFGYAIEDALWNVAYCIHSDTDEENLSAGCLLELIPFLVSEGADINFVRDGRSVLDLVTGKVANVFVANGATTA